MEKIDPIVDWANMKDLWYFNYYYSTLFSKSRGIFTVTNSNLSINKKVNNNKYEI